MDAAGCGIDIDIGWGVEKLNGEEREPHPLDPPTMSSASSSSVTSEDSSADALSLASEESNAVQSGTSPDTEGGALSLPKDPLSRLGSLHNSTQLKSFLQSTANQDVNPIFPPPKEKKLVSLPFDQGAAEVYKFFPLRFFSPPSLLFMCACMHACARGMSFRGQGGRGSELCLVVAD